MVDWLSLRSSSAFSVLPNVPLSCALSMEYNYGNEARVSYKEYQELNEKKPFTFYIARELNESIPLHFHNYLFISYNHNLTYLASITDWKQSWTIFFN